MKTWFCVWVIMAGRGDDREVIRIRKNIEADGKVNAHLQMSVWVHSVISGEFLSREDVRSEGYVSLGPGDTTGV